MAETENTSLQTEELPIELSKLSLEKSSQPQVSNASEKKTPAAVNETKSSSAASHALQSYQNSAATNSQAMTQNQAINSTAQLPKEAVEEESSEISASDDGSWISWFCSLRGNEFFCEVDEDYIQDDFNLTGLHLLVPYYDYALDMVLDVEMPMEEKLTEAQQEIVESAAVRIYVSTKKENGILMLTLLCAQLTDAILHSTGNALRAHSRTVHSNKPRDARYVRKVPICILW